MSKTHYQVLNMPLEEDLLIVRKFAFHSKYSTILIHWRKLFTILMYYQVFLMGLKLRHTSELELYYFS